MCLFGEQSRRMCFLVRSLPLLCLGKNSTFSYSNQHFRFVASNTSSHSFFKKYQRFISSESFEKFLQVAKFFALCFLVFLFNFPSSLCAPFTRFLPSCTLTLGREAVYSAPHSIRGLELCARSTITCSRTSKGSTVYKCRVPIKREWKKK